MTNLINASDVETWQRKFDVCPDVRTYPSADNEKPMSCAEIAVHLNLSRARVGQIEQAAIEKLRRIIQRQGLESALRELLK